MANPEQGGEGYDFEFKPQHKIMAAGTALVASVALALSVHLGKAESLAEKCVRENPPEAPGLTMEDYFNVWQDPANGQYYPSHDDRNVIEKLLQKQVDAYMISPQRNNRLASKVADFATVMVGRANMGDKGYKFYRPGDPGSGYFYGDPHKPVPDNYQGYGWLYRDVYNDNGKLIKQEITDDIYRFRDGSYATNPGPGMLSISDRHSQAVFTAPSNLGLDECALIPGNGATQGWRVEYYDFWPEGEFPPPGDIQGETFDYFHSDYYYPGEMDKVKQIENRAIIKVHTAAG